MLVSVLTECRQWIQVGMDIPLDSEESLFSGSGAPGLDGTVVNEMTRGVVIESTGGLVPVNEGESLSPLCTIEVTGVKPMSLVEIEYQC